jgi:hypothetical protein
MFLLECTIAQSSHSGSVDFNNLVVDGGIMGDFAGIEQCWCEFWSWSQFTRSLPRAKFTIDVQAQRETWQAWKKP